MRAREAVTRRGEPAPMWGDAGAPTVDVEARLEPLRELLASIDPHVARDTAGGAGAADAPGAASAEYRAALRLQCLARGLIARRRALLRAREAFREAEAAAAAARRSFIDETLDLLDAIGAERTLQDVYMLEHENEAARRRAGARIVAWMRFWFKVKRPAAKDPPAAPVAFDAASDGPMPPPPPPLPPPVPAVPAAAPAGEADADAETFYHLSDSSDGDDNDER
mmetsp:Transcript_15124/g.45562  ORF Transcript_15124/g.45562 Transcript_15124/m.45562 type:complete len:224 (-) Transcript_15124:2692-3363(-)